MPEPQPKQKTPAPLLFRYRLLAVIASAVLLTLANPPGDIGWLAWVAPVPLFWGLLGGGVQAFRRYSLGSGFRVQGSGEGVQAFGHSGIQEEAKGSAARVHPSSFNPHPSTPYTHTAILSFFHGCLYLMLLAPWFGAFSPAGYPVAGVYWGLLAALVWTVTLRIAVRLAPGWTPVLLAAGWTLWEWLRAQGTLAFPWGTLSVTQHRYVHVLQPLELTGAYGLTFLMALSAGSVALLWVGVRRRRAGEVTDYRAGVLWCRASALLVGLWLWHGLGVFMVPPRSVPFARVAVVQASESVQEGVAVRCISSPPEYASRTRAALAEGAELVVWPETARLDDVFRSSYAQNEIRSLLAGTGAELLTGSFVRDPESGQSMNAGVMLNAQAEVTGHYAKVLIVPFGEYLPLRPWLRWTEQLGMPPTDLKAGAGFYPLPWAKGKIGPSICFESAFGDVSRTQVLRGANLLANLTSDGWVGRTAAGYQHAGFAPLRAVETRRSMARSAATGVSALIDPMGRRLKTIPMFEKGYAVADLPLRSDITLHTRLGDWPVFLSVVLILWGALIGRLWPGHRVAGAATARR